MSSKRLTVKIDDEMLEKLRVIAESECRSASGEVAVLIRDEVSRFEAEHGEIKLDEK